MRQKDQIELNLGTGAKGEAPRTKWGTLIRKLGLKVE
jgi:hypothetical protein